MNENSATELRDRIFDRASGAYRLSFTIHPSEHGLAPLCELTSAQDKIAQLERDLAAMTRERDEIRASYQLLYAQREKALASAASPEVMRVADAVLAYRRRYPQWLKGPCMPCAHTDELEHAVDALSASRQPKAQEPRYVAEGCEVWDTVQRQADGSRRLLCRFYGIAACGAAQEHAARLNGEGGGK